MADGQVLIDSKLNTSGVERGAKEIKEEFQKLAKVTEKVAEKMEKELNGAGDAAEKTSGSFKDLFNANLSASVVLDVLKQMGQAAIELGKQAVETAAEINASNAQFEQTFKGIEKTARDSLNKISKEVGITASRMQDSYTKIFAFTKSVGADQEQALSISERALKAAADSAAYYDVSVEDATETLMSFIKGNYENDAALGIAATETTRNAKANELYAKSFQELSEAQKVDVLLAMVEAGNEASGALGQAAREADSWTNVLGELQEAWRLLLGVMGDPLLEGLIPIIQGITGTLQQLSNTAASMELFDNLDDYENTLQSIEEEFNATSEAIEKNASMAELYKERLLELEREGFDKNSAASREYANAVDALNTIYPELNLQISETTELLTAESKAMLGSLDVMKKKAVHTAYEEKHTAALKAKEDALVAVREAEKELQAVELERQYLEEQLIELTGRTAEELVTAYKDGTLALSEMTGEEGKLITLIRQLDEESRNLKQGIEEGNTAIAEQETQLKDLESQMEATGEAAGDFAEKEEEVAAATEEAATSQEELAKRFQEAKESARDSLESTMGLFNKLKVESDLSAGDIVKNLQSQQKALADYDVGLNKLIEMNYPAEMVAQLSDGTAKSMGLVQVLANANAETVAKIIEEWYKTQEISRATETTMAEVETNLTSVSESVGESVNTALTQVGEGAAAAMGEAAAQITVNFTTPVQEEVSNLGGVIEETFSNAAETMQEAWGDKAQWFQSNVESPIKTSTESIGSTMLSTLSSMESETAAAWNRMVQDVQNAINRMQSSINSLTGKTVNVTVNKTSGASAASAAAYTPAAVSAIPFGMPMLATGAVIPPNAPFFAILGDQKHGTNIEAPLETIKQAVAEVNIDRPIDIHIHFDGDLDQLGRILQPVIEEETRRIGPSLSESFVYG